MGGEDEAVEFDLDVGGSFLLTIVRGVRGEGRHMRRLSKGAEFAHVRLQLEPFHGVCQYRFEWAPIPGTFPAYFRLATLEGIKTALQEELPGARRVTHLRICVLDGTYHEHHTNVESVRLAAQLALRDALSRAALVAA